jgi:hypothetical protein
VSDDDLRGLERRWRESGDDAIGAAYLAARLRAGDLDVERLRDLARLGLGAAIACLGDDAPETLLGDAVRSGWRPARTRRQVALLLWRRHVLPEWEAAHPGDARLRELLDAFQAWIDDPSLDPPRQAPPDLDPDDAQRLHMFVRNGVPMLPREGLDHDVVHRDLRADLLLRALGAPPPDGALRTFARVSLELVACDDAPLEVVRATAVWLDGLSLARPRRLRATVAPERPPFVGLEETARGVPRPRESFVAFVTATRDAQGWFARHLPTRPRTSVIHLGERERARLEAAPEPFLAHMIGKKALDGLLGEKAPRHDPSRGCAFDFCADKVSLDARIRVGSVCRECLALLRRETAELPEETRAALLAVLSAARERALEER